ncbi:MAG: hypothetical protein GQ527_09715 [Bacteroidales bacterium]|nr:hypothetical protein [Bacteroidales bacterium]
MKISSGPLQGLTDAIFRSVHHKIWGGVDEYYGPYLRLDNHKEPKASQIRDIESPLNHNIHYVPQLMGNNPQLLLERTHWLKELGYTHVNWNLGCPYPMVTKRNMGAGLLNQPKLVNDILQEIMPSIPIALSIKCRLGLIDEREINPLLEVFNHYKLKEVMIHARTASQMYKGIAHPEKIGGLIGLSKNPIGYNGDLDSMEKISEVQTLFQDQVNHLMLGRGLLKKPYLALEAKGVKLGSMELKEKMMQFHAILIEQYGKKLQDHQLLMKMRTFWEYFSHSFSNPHKSYKLIKKSNNIKKYEAAVGQIFSSYSEF